MRRSIAVVTPAVLTLLVTEEARAATVDISIVGVSQGFSGGRNGSHRRHVRLDEQ